MRQTAFANRIGLVVIGLFGLVAGIGELSEATGATAAQAPEMTFDKVELRTTFGTAKEGKKGRLVVSGRSIRFIDKKGREFFEIPSDSVTDLFYSRVSGRRIKTAVFVSPLILFSKGKKHYMTVSFDDGGDLVGAVEFKLDKKNYRGVLHAVESVADVSMDFDQEGIKDEKESIATRGAAGGSIDPSLAVLEFTSIPDGAEIEIDGGYAGTTPRTKSLKPGEYKIKLKRNGFKDWERKIQVAAGEEIPIRATLEEK